MMRSMFSAISGLKSFQTAMDVVGNNIANVNTPGFKASRITFRTTLAQTIKGARSPSGGLGGINPMQIGLGSRVASIDKVMTQGSFQSTGKKTDLAIQGDGFFILTDGVRRYYTRAGNFDIDEVGNFIQASTGLKALGWSAIFDPTTGRRYIDTNQPIDEIHISAGMTLPAKKTSLTQLEGNLMSDVGFKSFQISLTDDNNVTHNVRVWFERAGQISGSSDPFDDTQRYIFKVDANGDGTPEATGHVVIDKFGNVVSSGFDEIASLDPSYLEDGQDNSDASSNLTLNLSTSYSGNYKVALIDGSGNVVRWEGSISGTTVDVTGSGTIVEGTVNASTTYDWVLFENDVDDYDATTATSDGTLTLNTNGTLSEGYYTVDLYDVEDNERITKNVYYSGTGSFVVSDSNINNGNRYIWAIRKVGSALTYRVEDGADLVITNTGEFKFYEADDPTNFVVPDYQVPKYMTSVLVYDSLGNPYQLYYEFVRLGQTDSTHKNVWIWRAYLPAGETISYLKDETHSISGAIGGVINFDETGRITDYGSITGANTSDIDWTNEAKYISFDTSTSGDGVVTIKVDLNKVSQYAGEFSAAVNWQDGYPLGTLESFAINEYGEIIGTFSNGITDTLGKLALAVFNNPAGLVDVGQSLYVESANSGVAKIGEPGTGGRGTLIPGALEMSNVDLAEEFTKMIIAQRGFQANARVITTSDQILAELVNMKR